MRQRLAAHPGSTTHVAATQRRLPDTSHHRPQAAGFVPVPVDSACPCPPHEKHRTTPHHTASHHTTPHHTPYRHVPLRLAAAGHNPTSSPHPPCHRLRFFLLSRLLTTTPPCAPTQPGAAPLSPPTQPPSRLLAPSPPPPQPQARQLPPPPCMLVRGGLPPPACPVPCPQVHPQLRSYMQPPPPRTAPFFPLSIAFLPPDLRSLRRHCLPPRPPFPPSHFA